MWKGLGPILRERAFDNARYGRALWKYYSSVCWVLAYRGRGEPWLECFERQAHASLDDALKSPLANHAPLGRITLATAAALRTSAKKSPKFDRRHVREGFGIISTTRVGFSFVRSYGRGKVGGRGAAVDSARARSSHRGGVN